MRRVCWLLVWCAGAACAAPMLRLTNSAVVVQVAPGANATSQTLYAHNIGDGSLSLSVSVQPGVSWVSASLGAVGTCWAAAVCIPLQFAFDTKALPQGAYTAEVTISDPSAIDAPQIVTVTVQVGAAASWVVDRFVAPGGTNDASFPLSGWCASGAGCPGYYSSTQDGGAWLVVSVDGRDLGTLFFPSDLWVHLRPPATMTPGTYTGAVHRNQELVIPVTMHVTTQPIANPSVTQISAKVGEGGPAMTYPFVPYVALTNSGLGTLEVQGVSASGPGVSAYLYGDLAIVAVDPSSLAPGSYKGSVSIQCNGANCPVQVPVSFDIAPRGPPLIYYQGVVDNATFSPSQPLAPGDIAIIKGEQLSPGPAAFASATPLPTTLGGARVLVNSVYASLFYSSAGQIAFQVPGSTAPGLVLVEVERDGQAGNTVSAQVVPRAPQIVVVTDAEYNLRDLNHPTHVGETLIIWTIGLGPTDPPVPDGAAAPNNPPAVVTLVPAVNFGFAGCTFAPQFAGLAPGLVGLYQVVTTVPACAPAATVPVGLAVSGRISNSVPIAVVSH